MEAVEELNFLPSLSSSAAASNTATLLANPCQQRTTIVYGKTAQVALVVKV